MFTPVQFGKYYLTERIAVGGMAELFKAKLHGVSGLEKEMVVKQILPSNAKNSDFVKMFIDEANIAVTLLHKNIVPVYELGKINGVYFIAMEYVHGQDLADLMEAARTQKRPISPEHAAFVTAEICKGLHHAHCRTDSDGNPAEVIHRDISPPNIMISMQGEVKITDFGIAKAARKLGTTEAGVVKGTFGYMSPEQVRGLPIDHRTDVFSAGILLHEMLTGQRLFPGDNELEAIERVKEARIPAPSVINPEIHPAIDPVVIKALAKEPSDRFSDANEFQLALSRFLFSTGKSATSTTLGRYMQELFPEKDASGRGPSAAPQEPVSASPSAEVIVPQPQEPGEKRKTAQNRPPLKTADVGAGAPLTLNSTLALPTIAEEAQPRPSLDFQDDFGLEPMAALPGDDDEALAEMEVEKTAVFKRDSAGPQKPEVPELRFPPRQERAPKGGPAAKVNDLFDLNATPHGDPSSSDLARSQAMDAPAAEGTTEGAAPDPEDLAWPELPQHGRKKNQTGRQTVASPTVTSNPPSGLEALLSGEAAAASEEDASNAGPSEAKNAPTSGPQGPLNVPRRRKKRTSAVLSATMRLFVGGLPEEEPEEDAEPSESFKAAVRNVTAGPIDAGPTAAVSPARRSVKPTVLGWVVILFLVAGATAFVYYQRPDLFRGGPSLPEQGMLKAEDIRREAPAQPKAAPKGSVKLSSEPAGATFFRFIGEAPVTLKDLDPGQDHVLLLEREGYQSAYRLVRGAEFVEGTAQVTVHLNPVGPGAQSPLERPTPAGTPSGKKGTLEVESDPPVAMVWLMVGDQAEVLVENLDTSRSADFKALLPGYRPGLTHISPVDFQGGKSTYVSKVTLEKDPDQAKAADLPAPGEKAAPPSGTGDNQAAPGSKSPGVQKATGRKNAPRRRMHRRKRGPAKKKKIQMPSWAR